MKKHKAIIMFRTFQGESALDLINEIRNKLKFSDPEMIVDLVLITESNLEEEVNG